MADCVSLLSAGGNSFTSIRPEEPDLSKKELERREKLPEIRSYTTAHNGFFRQPAPPPVKIARAGSVTIVSADSILLNTTDIEVKDEMGIVTIRRKPGFYFALSGGLIGMGLLFQLFPVEMFIDDPQTTKALFKVFSSMLILLGTLILMIYILQPHRNIRIVDMRRSSILYDGDCIPFTKVSEITLRSTSIMYFQQNSNRKAYARGS
ncbi:MAG: hypothetical protein AB9903_33855 [Vulcanimicrobiota bacterium]